MFLATAAEGGEGGSESPAEVEWSAFPGRSSTLGWQVHIAAKVIPCDRASHMEQIVAEANPDPRPLLVLCVSHPLQVAALRVCQGSPFVVSLVGEGVFSYGADSIVILTEICTR